MPERSCKILLLSVDRCHHSQFSALPSVWSINLYLWQQSTFVLKTCKPFCPAVVSTLICNTVGRVCSKQSGYPVSFKVFFTEDEHAVYYIFKNLYECALYKIITCSHNEEWKEGGKYNKIRNNLQPMPIVFCHYLQHFKAGEQRGGFVHHNSNFPLSNSSLFFDLSNVSSESYGYLAIYLI